MKKSTFKLAFLLLVAFQTAFATTFTVSISGFSYSPATTNASVGDVITISASTTHPLVQVDQTDWNTGTPTPLSTGWGTKTTAYTFTITTAADIYFMCSVHGPSGMKGKIVVTGVGINQLSNITAKVGLFPNPVTNGEFTVKTEGYSTANGKILIYNTEGQLLETYSLTGVETPVKTKLPSGVYFYDVMINSKQVHRSKFLVSSAK